MFNLKTECTDESGQLNARCGELETMHGTIHTPAFMPVATKAYVKTVTPEEMIEQGTQVIIANSFLIYLRPGLEIIKDAGGLHKFMNWSKPIFTDSGGFQMIRPDFHAKVDDHGITFQSPFDGTKHIFTPEKCVDIQVELGVDVAMMLDHCPKYGSNLEEIKIAAEHTTDWAKRSLAALEHLRDTSSSRRHMPLLFGIVQGGTDVLQRQWSARTMTVLDFDGFGIGGLSIGEPKEKMYEALKEQVPLLPEDRVRYLMGVGSPEDVLECIAIGVDLFDSVFPTRNARHGTVHTKNGNLNINRAPYSKQFIPLDEDCGCLTCTAGFTRAYINHLLKNHSILGMRFTTIHNLYFLQQLVRIAKERISEGTFHEFKDEFVKKFRKRSNR